MQKLIGDFRIMGNFSSFVQQVYCEEEGAFVFPSFAVANLPLQCGPRYFVKLSGCSGPFSNIFQLKHGDPKLCRYVYDNTNVKSIISDEQFQCFMLTNKTFKIF